MYHNESGANPAAIRPALDTGLRRPNAAVVSPTVYAIGAVSLLTDISAEMVASILPFYLFTVLKLSPLEYGLIDGLFNGSTALVRLAAAWWADRVQRHKSVALLGYAMSALSKLGLIVAGIAGWFSVAVVLLIDRLGKGIRTAPRDTLIAQHAQSDSISASFGVHRALDAIGAMLGPLLATGLLLLLPGRFDILFAVSFVFALAGIAVLILFVRPRYYTRFNAHSSRTDDTTTKAGNLESSSNATNKVKPALNTASERWTYKVRRIFSPEFVWLCAASTLLGAFTLSDNLIYLGVIRQTGLQGQFLPLMFVATAAIFMLLAIPVGRQADRRGPLPVFLFGHVCVLFTYLIVASNALAPNLLPVMVVVLLGTYYACTDGVLMALLAKRLPEHSRATGMAILTSLLSVARMLASFLFGWLWNNSSHQQATLFFALALSLSLVAAGFALARFARADRVV